MAYFQYAPQWQGPLPGRSFEKQTEDAINGVWGRCDEILQQCTQPATQTSSGQMTAQDKAKLDGIEAGANFVAVDASLSLTSSNPVQNSAVTAVLDARVTAAMIDSLFS